MNESELASLIAAIYDAGIDFSRWPETLGSIAAAFGAPSAGMARQGKTPFDCWGSSFGIEPAATQSYVDYYHSVNPIWQRVPSTPAGTVQTDAMVVPRKEFVRTEFFNDYLQPQRLGGLLNAVALLEDGRQTVVTVHSGREFEASDVALYKLLAPHLERAVQINLRLARAEINHAASLEVINRLGQGVIFVDVKASVIFANSVAEKSFLTDSGLRQSEGILHSNSVAESAALHATIAGCAKSGSRPGAGGFISLTRGSKRAPLSLLVAPLSGEWPRWFGGKHPVAIVFVTDPETSTKPASDQLRDRFGLTRAEAALAVEILDGDGIQAAADRLSISRGTARTHLSRVFDKTETRRQSELVRLLLSTKLSINRD